jgi:hypothetical protein
MKKFIFAVALLMTVGLAVPAIADDDNANNKIAIGFYFPGNNQGSFSMVGAGDAHGKAEVTSAATSPDPNGGLRIKTTKTLHYPAGDIYMATEGVIDEDTAEVRVSTGTWTFTGGTGLYANVWGGGHYHWFRNKTTGILTGAYAGTMKLDSSDHD